MLAVPGPSQEEAVGARERKCHVGADIVVHPRVGPTPFGAKLGREVALRTPSFAASEAIDRVDKGGEVLPLLLAGGCGGICPSSPSPALTRTSAGSWLWYLHVSVSESAHIKDGIATTLPKATAGCVAPPPPLALRQSRTGFDGETVQPLTTAAPVTIGVGGAAGAAAGIGSQ